MQVSVEEVRLLEVLLLLVLDAIVGLETDHLEIVED